MNRTQRRELIGYFRSEFRRLYQGELSGPVMYLNSIATQRSAPTPPPMSLPAVLLVPDTEAGKQRFAQLAFGGEQ